METIISKNLDNHQSILNGLSMLAESKQDCLSSLVELSTILLDNKTRHYFGLDNESGDKIKDLISSIHYLLKDLNIQSVDSLKEIVYKAEETNNKAA